jgi:hypothetical protein
MLKPSLFLSPNIAGTFYIKRYLGNLFSVFNSFKSLFTSHNKEDVLPSNKPF